MFKVWVQMLQGPTQTLRRKATADASRASSRLCRLLALGICHVSASAPANEQPAEAGADGKSACT